MGVFGWRHRWRHGWRPRWRHEGMANGWRHGQRMETWPKGVKRWFQFDVWFFTNRYLKKIVITS